MPRLRSALTGFLALTGAAGLSACDKLLDVELPTRIVAETLEDPALAATLVNSAVADFECAYVNYAAGTGTLVDELDASTGFIVWTLWDQRRVFPNDGSLSSGTCLSGAWSVYSPLHTARFQAEHIAKNLEGWTDQQVTNRIGLLATAYAYAGYSYILLGEGFCEVAVDQGPILKPAAVLAIAEERLTTALQHATAAGASYADIRNMALVGRARVRLDLGKTAEAVTDAQLVPQGFVKNATYSAATARRWNRVFTRNQQDLYVSVTASFRNLTFGGVPDPRVRVTDAGRRANDGLTPLWYQQKYTAQTSPIPLATWKEAVLIVAEVQGGQTAVDNINLLHTAAGLPAFSSSDPATIAAQVLEERRREFFLDGHRLNDMLRFNLPFPTGKTLAGVDYGATTCLPLSDDERANNPNAS
ncbi:MAG: RagB/SusD family nutrient uptake outer membrane protein [Gemmatimonadetes bacterium]|nr:RagB/SusD family nutrient uptake outer membrane protein [Gemmatimonadota bacterium]